jgi:hypothetical protein
LAGPYELKHPGRQSPDVHKIPLLSQIFSLLNYDLGVYCSKIFPNATQENNGFLKDWTQLNETSQEKIFSFDTHKVACLIFPEDPQTDTSSWEAVIQAIQEKAKLLRDKTDLIIGISPWGWQAEQLFIKNNHGAVDILLGSGHGPAIRGQLSKDKKTLWVRPYSKGKVITRIKISYLTNRETPRQWTLNQNITPGYIALNSNIQGDSQVTSLIYKARHGKN